MSDLEIWIAIILLTVATIVTRSSFFLLAGVKLPARVQHALRYAPAAALGAIVIPDLVMTGGSVTLGLSNPKLLAGIGAAVFFLLTRHLLGTIIVGMLLFTALRFML